MDEKILRTWLAARKALVSHEFTSIMLVVFSLLLLVNAVQMGVPEIVRQDAGQLEEAYYYGAWASCVLIVSYQTGDSRATLQICGQHTAALYEQRTHEIEKPQWWEWPPPDVVP